MASHLRVEREVGETQPSPITAGVRSIVCDKPSSDGPSLPLLPSTLCSHPLPAGIEQATQRLMQMRLAQPALMPDPRCLDAPPPGMMQLCHRESVVLFINKVRCPRLPAPSCRLCPTPHPRLVLPAPGM